MRYDFSKTLHVAGIGFLLACGSALATEKTPPPESSNPPAAHAAPEAATTAPQLTLKDLSSEERDLVEDGKITTGQHIIGGILSIYPGLGVGHLVQSRYSSSYSTPGWIFTVGEVASATLLIASLSSCINETFLDFDRNGRTCSTNAGIVIGLVAYMGFHIWEVIDAWVAPGNINRRYDRLQERLGQKTSSGPRFFLTPITEMATGTTAQGARVTPGLALGVQFQL